MRIWNLNTIQVETITKKMGICAKRLDEDSKSVNVTLRPIDSRARFSRSSYSYGFSTPRRGPWLCYHGFEEFIRQAFAGGADRVKSVQGDWRSLEEFVESLWELGSKNVGSMRFPIALGDDCPCDCFRGR